MFLFLSKFLPLLVYPLGLAGLCILAALLLRPSRLRTLVLVLAFLLIWLGGNRWVASTLVRSLEWRYLPEKELPPAPVIVVAGGGVRAGDYPRPIVEVDESGDRLIYAAYLYHQGKAPFVLLSGGGMTWYAPDTDGPGMDALLQILGVPKKAIIIESASRNTYENALFSHKILEKRAIDTIILVTSAMHMPRTASLYAKQGFDIIPAPTDYLLSQAEWRFLIHADIRTQLLNLIPNAEYMRWTYLALKEYLGMTIYHLRGWM